MNHEWHLKPLVVYFGPFTNSARDTKYHKRSSLCSGVPSKWSNDFAHIPYVCFYSNSFIHDLPGVCLYYMDFSISNIHGSKNGIKDLKTIKSVHVE